MHLQAEEFVAEIEKDNFQSVMHRCARVHPDHTLGLLVDKLEVYIRNLECKGFRDNVRNDQSNAGAWR